MKALWATLIDTSGSMGEPFSGKSDFQGLIEVGSYDTKLDAAKKTVLKQLNGLPSSDVAIVGFADQPYLVCKRRVNEAKQFEESIQKLRADGGTNIAAALLFALTELSDLRTYKVINFLVISDGLSTQGDPISAAQECADSPFGIRISTILIDPTPEGQEIALGISIGGDVKAVSSDSGLETAVVEKKAEYEHAVQSAAEAGILLKVIAAMAAFSGLSVTTSGIYTAIVERPNIAIPTLFASVVTISAGILIYLILAKERIERGFYISSDAQEMYFPKRYKYGKRLRVFALVGGITCIILAVSLVLTAVVTKNRETTKNKETAERAVDQFHHQLDSRQYYEIYGGAADAYRRSIKQSDAIILYETVNRKLGSVMKSNQNGWGINYAPDGAMLSLAYTTEFIHGNATEQFVWIVVGNKASLYQYNINSRLLLDLDYASPNNSYNPTPR